jgi:hypothetical protein
MSLPLTRNRTYAAGSQVFSTDLNAIQDEIVALQTGGPAHVGVLTATSAVVSGHVTTTGGLYKRPSRTRVIPASAGTPKGGVNGSFGSWQASSGVDEINIPIVLEEGERLIAVHARVNPFDGGGGQLTLVVNKTGSSLGSASSSGLVEQTITVSTPSEVAHDGGNTFYNANIIPNVGGDFVLGIRVVTDVP